MMRRPTATVAAFAAAVFVFLSPHTFAQVEVVESAPAIRPIGQPRNGTAPVTSTTNAPAATLNAQSELYFQLQTLQQEVAELRGLVEEQAFELKRLKQQRMDDYVDLDRRMSELNKGGSGVAPPPRSPTATDATPAPSGNSQTAVAGVRDTASADEVERYNAAMDLIRAKQYDQAIAAFTQHLGQFPQGQYAANAYHWLGQLYQLRNKPNEARDAYQQVVSNYPSHNKAPDAKLKLGQLLFQLGDKVKAKTLLEEVANGGTDESRLAKNFLQENFK